MSEVINIKELNERIERESVFVDTLRNEMGKVIVGQSHLGPRDRRGTRNGTTPRRRIPAPPVRRARDRRNCESPRRSTAG